MDQKQFKKFQSAIQYAVDDEYLARHNQPATGWRWNQRAWGVGKLIGRRRRPKNNHLTWSVVCPTAGCVAGTIAIQAGDKMVVPGEFEDYVGMVNVEYCVDKSGNLHEIPQRAMEVLGLEEAELHDLFSGDNTIEDVVEIATRIAEEHGYRLELAESIA